MDNHTIARPQSATQKFDVGLVVRGDFRRMLLLETNLEFKEHKFFLSSIFVVKATGERQIRQLRKVNRLVERLSRDD